MSGRARTESQRRARKVLRHARWVEWLPRVGYLTRGLLYATVGFLAFQLAVGAGGFTADLQGVITTIAGQTFGKIALVAIIVGLAGYATWGFVRAIMDPLG